MGILFHAPGMFQGFFYVFQYNSWIYFDIQPIMTIIPIKQNRPEHHKQFAQVDPAGFPGFFF